MCPFLNQTLYWLGREDDVLTSLGLGYMLHLWTEDRTPAEAMGWRLGRRIGLRLTKGWMETGGKTWDTPRYTLILGLWGQWTATQWKWRDPENKRKGTRGVIRSSEELSDRFSRIVPGFYGDLCEWFRNTARGCVGYTHCLCLSNSRMPINVLPHWLD